MNETIRQLGLATGPAPRAIAGRFDSIDAAMRRAVARGDVAGVVAMGATAQGEVYSGAFGHADLRTGAPMREDAVFWLLSMTKTITATACMQLVEQGKLRLDQEAREILPELANPQVLEGFDDDGRPRLRPARRPITIRHLMTHTSGYTYANWSAALTRYEQVTGMPDIASLRNAAFAAPLEFDPGERWEYGIGMDWIGKIVEQVSGQSLEVYFRENFFEPLGMKDSGFLMSSAQKRRVATLFNRQADGSLVAAPFEMPQRPEFFMGGGGAFSTPRDYMRLLRALLNGGELDGVRILRPETVASMMANHIGDLDVHEMRSAHPEVSNDFDQFPGEAHKWGLSFDINERPGPNGRSAGSASWTGLLNCYFWIDPVKKVAGALFTQILPCYDARVVALYGELERGIYRALDRRPSLRDALVGAWQLVSCRETDLETGEVFLPMGTEPDGLILYTPDGYMSAQLSAPARHGFASGDMYRGTAQEYVDAGASYLAYSGPYYVDEEERTIEHEMFVSLFPNWKGQRQARIAKLDGDELRLSPDRPHMFNGSLKSAEIVWRRATPNGWPDFEGRESRRGRIPFQEVAADLVAQNGGDQ